KGNRHRAPGTRPQSIHNDEAEHGDEHYHNPEHSDERRVAGHRSDLLLRHLAERLSIAPNRGGENDEILDRAAKDDADDDPDRAREKSELRGQRWTDQRAGASNGREMMAKDDPAIRRHVVASIVQQLGGSR